MAEITRRTLVGQAAALAGAATLANATTHAAEAQDKTEIRFFSIWGAAPGTVPRANKSPDELTVEAFNAQSATTTVTLENPGGYLEVQQKLQAELATTLETSLKPIATGLVEVDGKHYGMPYGMSTPIIYYNAEIFEDAGIDPMVLFATWESFATEGAKPNRYGTSSCHVCRMQ